MKENLFQYILELADDSVILGQRLAEWCGHGPALELDMALTNVSLDLFGQARYFYQYASEVQGESKTEDDLAFLRDFDAFRNSLIVEIPNGDFAQTIVRQYFFDEFQVLLYTKLSKSSDHRIAEIAQKSLKETIYHRRLSRDWMLRLGDGTEESRERMQNAVDLLWSYTGSMFIETKAAKALMSEGISFSTENMKVDWKAAVHATLKEATLSPPESAWMQKGGRGPMHTEYLGYILAEMQVMQRAHPGLSW